MKRILLFCTVLFFMFALYGCGESKVEYTYTWAEPSFSGETVTKEFDDFSIQYPSDWIVTSSTSIEDAANSNGIFFIISTTSGSSYYANMSIAYTYNRMTIQEVNDTFADDTVAAAEQQLGTDISVENLLYGNIYGTDQAFLYMTAVYQGYNLRFIQQYVPARIGSYLFTYTINGDQIPEDVISIMNSVKFKP